MSGPRAAEDSRKTLIHWPIIKTCRRKLRQPHRPLSQLPQSEFSLARTLQIPIELRCVKPLKVSPEDVLQEINLPRVDPTSQVIELRQVKQCPPADPAIDLPQVDAHEVRQGAKDQIKLDVTLDQLMEMDNAESDVDSYEELGFPELSSNDLIPNNLIGNRYRVEGLLGRGGMGEVYLCRDEVKDNWVAIKVAKDVESRELIADEIKTLLNLRGNRHIVDILASGVNFIVLEFIEGKTLFDFARDNRPRRKDYDLTSYQRVFTRYTVDTLKIIREIFKGLEHVHSRDEVHADLTGDNVMLKDNGVKIFDFGISGLVKKAKDGTVFGKPYSMSPEQARTEQLDGRTDIYSAGIILYRMLTARRPYNIPAEGREFPQEDIEVEILVRKEDGDRFGFPLPIVAKSDILNIFGAKDSSWRDLFINIWTVDRRKVLKVFGKDSSWRSFFVDPSRRELTFRPEINVNEITSIQDTEKRVALLAMFNRTRRDVLTFRPDAKKIIKSRYNGELNKRLIALHKQGIEQLRRSVPFYNLGSRLKAYLGEDLGERIYNLMDKMTAVDREERFQTATEARLAVKAILEDIERTSACPLE